MKTLTKMGFQGDVMFELIDELPATAVKQERTGDIVVSHSETGHNHVVKDRTVTHYEDSANPLVCYLSLEGAFALVEHLRDWDTHETVKLPSKPGKAWKCRRQREMAPEGWRRVQD